MDTVLIVDDETKACEFLRKILMKKGFTTFEAYNGVEALEFLKKNKVDVVLLDIKMPKMGGVEAVEKIKQEYPDVEVIMVTALSELSLAIDCMKSGAYGYLPKPVNAGFLVMEIDKALERRRLYLQNQEYKQNLEAKVEERTCQVRQLFNLLEKNFFESVRMFVDMIGLYDPLLVGHSKRVSILAVKTGEKFDLDQGKLKDLEIAALLHDIWRLGIPERIQNSPFAQLRDKEIEIVKNQTILAQNVLSSVEKLKRVGQIIRSYQERVDGSGFPDGLTGNEIILESKILSVANAFDEVKNRYRFSREKQNRSEPDEKHAIDHLEKYAWKKFHRDVVNKFLEVLEEIRFTQKRAKPVSLKELEAGMVLANDLYADNGELLLSREAQFDEMQISKIKNYHQLISPVRQKIFIKE